MYGSKIFKHGDRLKRSSPFLYQVCVNEIGVLLTECQPTNAEEMTALGKPAFPNS